MTDPSGLQLAVAALAAGGTVIYALMGGADFGGGVWGLLASGARKRAQREIVARAVAPIWEANHVWLIFVIVVLFVCFPTVYATIGTALHLPLVAMLLGIVLRGSAFALRSHNYGPGQRNWDLVFGLASAVTPVTLGLCIGAIASGQIRVDAAGQVTGGFIAPWLAPFPVAVGLAVLVEFAHLAATYLVFEVEPTDARLRADFAWRAALSGAAGIACVIASALAMPRGAPVLWAGFLAHWWWIPLTMAAMIGSTAASATGRTQLARGLAVARLTLIASGWALAQFPYLVVPDLDIAGAAAPDVVLASSGMVIAIGSLVLIPSFAWLYVVFKAGSVRG